MSFKNFQHIKRYFFLIFVLSIVLSLATAFAEDNLFLDIGPSHPHFEAVTALRNHGVVNGFGDNTFQADKAVNRAESLKIILLGSNIPEPEPPLREIFPDVPTQEWFSTFVREGKNRGIIDGTAEGRFEPMRTINQAEALKMVFLTNEIPVKSTLSSSPFENVSRYEWFAPYYDQAKKKSILFSSEVNPGKALSRGELVEIMHRFQDGAQTYSYPIGVMSYYGDSFNGRTTSSGDRFDNAKFTAAHRTLPFGTKLLVTSFSSGKSTVVEVNDRGPYVAYRNLDLSKAAFSVLEPPSRGLLRGEIQQIDSSIQSGAFETLCSFPSARKVIPATAFEGITLSESLPTLFRKNEIFFLEGTAQNTDIVTVFWSEEEKQRVFSVPVVNGNFMLSLPFLNEGSFEIGIVTGRSGRSTVYPIEIVDAPCLLGNTEISSSVQNLRGTFRDGAYVLQWNGMGAELFRVLFSQEEKSLEFFINGTEEFTLPPQVFEVFHTGKAEVRISAVDLSSNFSIDPSRAFSPPVKLDLLLTGHQFFEGDKGKIKSHTLPSTFSLGNDIVFSGNFNGEIREDGAIILPNGEAVTVPLITKGQTFTFRFTPEQIGTHIVEINSKEGFALLNAPVYYEGLAPLLPDYFDINPRHEQEYVTEINLKRDRLKLLRLINIVREKQGLSKLMLHDNMNDLAQLRSDDMAENKYFSHISPEGKGASDFVSRFDIGASVLENIAADINYSLAHHGLMRSAIHRQNILNPDVTRAGFGIARDESGSILVTQLFAEDALSNDSIAEYQNQMVSVLNSQREGALNLDAHLSEASQEWAQKMADEGFFGYEAPDGQDFFETAILIQERKNASVDSILYTESSFQRLLDSLSYKEDTSALFREKYTNIGIGFFVAPDGTLYVVMVLTE